MKKIVLIFTLALAFTLSACGKDNQAENNTSGENNTPEVTTPTESVTGESETETVSVVIEMPILDEIDKNTTVGTAGAFMKAVQSAVKLLDWGVATGLGADEIEAATAAWINGKSEEEQAAFKEKLTVVDEAYQRLLADGAEDLLASAGCADSAYPWSSTPVESIEAVMKAAGLR